MHKWRARLWLLGRRRCSHAIAAVDSEPIGRLQGAHGVDLELAVSVYHKVLARAGAGRLAPGRGRFRNRPRLSHKPRRPARSCTKSTQLDFGGDQISPPRRSIAARRPYTTSDLRRPARVCGFSTRPFLCATASSPSSSLAGSDAQASEFAQRRSSRRVRARLPLRRAR
jgi:hypothetical protein